MELCHTAEQNDKQNKRLLALKGIKESWDGLHISFPLLLYTVRVAVFRPV